MKKETYTVKEAAEILSCNPETVRRAIRANELKAARLGSDYRISKRDLDTYYRALGGGALYASNITKQDTEPELKIDRDQIIAEIAREIKKRNA
jgi:excisionase family DNA binding protein